MPGAKPLALFFPFSLLSHYLRCVELADSINEDYTVMFADAGEYDHFIKQRGYVSFPCENYDPVEMISCASRFDFSWINERSIERVFLSQVACIEQLKPVIVVGDGVNTLKMAAEITGVKYVSLMNGYMTKYYSLVRDVPSSHPAAKYSRKLPPRVYGSIIRMAEKLAFRQVHRPFKKTRKKYCLRKLSLFPDEMEGDLNFILDLHELFPQKSLPHNYIQAGPLFHTGAGEEQDDNFGSDRPTILVSMGSSGSWNSIACLNDSCFSNYRIIAAGDHKRVLNGPHITHHSFVSGHAAWRDVQLVICHGGNGTIYQALSKEIPVLCRTHLFEQEYNARRIEELGLGACFSGQTGTGELKEMADRWIYVKREGKLAAIAAKINVNETKRIFAEAMRAQLGVLKS